VERWEAIIVGAGPAGCAAGLRLAARMPSLAAGTLLLDKARHPRDKVCAGGVIPKARTLMAELGVALDVPQVRVDTAGVAVPDGWLTMPGDDVCRVVRRRDLDARLAWAARASGVALREEARVVAVARDGAGVRVETATESHWAPLVVGADGSGSLVRRALVTDAPGVVGRAVMCDVPVSGTRWDGHAARRYEFDFRPVMRGVRGYAWAFPCLIGDVPHVNVGVYALPPVSGVRLQRELECALADVGAAPRRWQAFPIHTWARAPAVAASGVLLAGDAAGCDPLMGEGISFALEYGVMAADAVVAARTRGADAGAVYRRAVAGGRLGRKLRRLEWASRRFYGPHARAWFRLAGASRRAQRIGLAWYNGGDGWDARGGWAALRELLWPGTWQHA
jgi:flavin-dependent dehydrogenase